MLENTRCSSHVCRDSLISQKLDAARYCFPGENLHQVLARSARATSHSHCLVTSAGVYVVGTKCVRSNWHLEMSSRRSYKIQLRSERWLIARETWRQAAGHVPLSAQQTCVSGEGIAIPYLPAREQNAFWDLWREGTWVPVSEILLHLSARHSPSHAAEGRRSCQNPWNRWKQNSKPPEAATTTPWARLLADCSGGRGGDPQEVETLRKNSVTPRPCVGTQTSMTRTCRVIQKRLYV